MLGEAFQHLYNPYFIRKNNMRKYGRTSGFTLVEVLVSVALSGMILTTAYAAFQGIMRSQAKLTGTIDIQRNLFYLNEKLAAIIHNGGTVDYEEYYNRRVLGFNKKIDATGMYSFEVPSNFGNGDNAS
jgi:prepilin-type N-terminal cleavage/methylation domain-containing protein